MTTLHDVALTAGVSDATASRALRGVGKVKSETRSKVMQAARSLNFTLSRNASSLATGKTMRVTILLGTPLNSWFSANCMEGVYEVLSKNGYDPVPNIVRTEQDLHTFLANLPTNKRNMDGLIITSIRIDNYADTNLDSFGIPVVGLDAMNSELLDASVSVDNEHSMLNAVRFLKRLGHKTIGYVQHPHPNLFPSNSELREAYFVAAAKELGYSEQDTVLFKTNRRLADSNISFETASAELAGRITSSDVQPTAICVETDEAAIALTQNLRSLGIRVPEDISIIGFDDDSNAKLANLTTIHQDPVDMARTAAQQLIYLMNGAEIENPSIRYRTTLIPRGSTIPLR